MTTTPLPISPEFTAHATEAHHWPLDYAQAAGKRKDVAILGMGLVILGLIYTVAHLALHQKPPYVVAIAPNGEEYVLSEPKKALDLRDELIYKQVIQDLMTFSESYFERSRVTAQKDYERTKWFLPDTLLAGYEAAALGEHGWLAELQNGTLPESHARIDSIELRAADILKEPYQTRIYLTRTTDAGVVSHTIASVTFVVRPQLAAQASRVPLYNALGLFIVKPIEEVSDFRK